MAAWCDCDWRKYRKKERTILTWLMLGVVLLCVVTDIFVTRKFIPFDFFNTRSSNDVTTVTFNNTNSFTFNNVTTATFNNTNSFTFNNVTTATFNNTLNLTRRLTIIDNSVEYYNSKSAGFLSDLKEIGIEPAEAHDFKSRMIITPYAHRYLNNTILRAPGVRQTKVISFHGVQKRNRWFIDNHTSKRDFMGCPYSECKLDVNGDKVNTADLVLFICKGLRDPPKQRPNGQLWALGCWESDVHWDYGSQYETVWKDAFNMTFSYREDSEVSFRRKLAWRHPSRLVLKKVDYQAMARNKTKTATWWASNCRRDRLNYVKEMQKYIDIDIYGRCGSLKCPMNSNSCGSILASPYKFYLSFENSFCKDYVTEKVMKLFNEEDYNHIVPVVKGGLDYDKSFPPLAIVNGNKFQTAKDLALYLKNLGNDVERYARMLQEKDKLVSPNRGYSYWCDVCKLLHTKKVGVYRDIRKTWSHGRCSKSGYNI